MANNKCYFEKGQYFFGYGTSLHGKEISEQSLISVDDYVYATLSDTSEAGLVYVRHDNKYGVFTFAESDNGGINSLLLSSNIYPFIYDEIWHNGDDQGNGIGYVAVRINNGWGILRVEDHMLDKSRRAQRRCMMIIPCIYPTREKAISFIKSKDYHPEYGWHEPFSVAHEHKLPLCWDIAPLSSELLITPDNITHLEPNEIFVFGSNLQGAHGGGAARVAYEQFGAEWGAGVGPTGQCYAIPTMQGGVETIKPYVDEFIAYAKQHPEQIFYVTRIGCGIAGFTDKQIAPLFAAARDLNNVALPDGWR